MRFIGKKEAKKPGFSKTKLLLGAGGLLLFIVGIKRTYQLEDAGGTLLTDEAVRRPDVSQLSEDSADTGEQEEREAAPPPS